MEFSLFSSNLLLKIETTAGMESVQLIHPDGRVLRKVSAADTRQHQTVSVSHGGYSGWFELRPGATSFLEVQLNFGTARRQLACVELIRNDQGDVRAILSGPVVQALHDQTA